MVGHQAGKVGELGITNYTLVYIQCASMVTHQWSMGWMASMATREEDSLLLMDISELGFNGRKPDRHGTISSCMFPTTEAYGSKSAIALISCLLL